MPPPPNDALSSAQIQLIETWINQGALNNSCTEAASGCDTTDYTLSGFLRPILQQKCQGCHSTASQSGGVDLESYAGIKTVADNGKLLGSISHDAGFSPMPQGQSQLDSCTIRKVELWINSGAPNN